MSIQVALYYGGEVKNGASGVHYTRTATRMIFIPQKIRYYDMLTRVSQSLGLDNASLNVTMLCRYPIVDSVAGMQYTSSPLNNDDDMRHALSILDRFPRLKTIEIYVITSPRRADANNYGQSQVNAWCTPNNYVQPYGGFTQLLSGGVGISAHSEWGQYAAMLQNENPSQLVPYGGTMNLAETSDLHQTRNVVGCSSNVPRVVHSGRDKEYVAETDSHESESDDDDSLESEDFTLDEDDMVPIPGDDEDDREVQYEVPTEFFADAGQEEDTVIFGRGNSRDRLWREEQSGTLDTGMRFKSKKGMKHAVRMWAARNNRFFSVKESRANTWFIRCLYFEQGCQWKLRATFLEGCGFWEITKFLDVHACTQTAVSTDHVNVDCNLVGDLVRDHININPRYGTKDVAETVRNATNVDISYRKAWYGRGKAIKTVYGDWDESYQELPRFMAAMESANPGTIVRWKHDRELSSDRENVFGSVFWTFKACIDGFRYCRPLISVDACHLYGKYREKLLIAVGVDAGNHIFPLAFAVADEESAENWGWFLRNMRQFILGDMQHICLISDRAGGTLAAVQNDRLWQPPFAHHRICMKHLMQNLIKKFTSNQLGDMMWQAATEHQASKFAARMQQIREFKSEAYDWLMRVPLDKWTLSHDEGRRYAVTTTNASESLNSVLKDARHLPITACVRATFHRTNTMFVKSRTKAQNYLSTNTPWPEPVQQKFNKIESNAGRHIISAYDRTQGMYEVVTPYNESPQHTGVRHIVNLNERTCTCGKFQLYHMPCSHAMKVCQNMKVVAQGLVAEFYSSRAMANTYAVCFSPLRDRAYWAPAQFTLLPNPLRRNSKPGRPKSKRFQSDMDMRRRKKCSVCRLEGHTKNNCPSAARYRAV